MLNRVALLLPVKGYAFPLDEYHLLCMPPLTLLISPLRETS